MAADAAGEPVPPPLPPPSASAANGSLPADGLDHEAGVPLGLSNAAVLDYGTAAQHPALTAGRKRYLCYFLHRHLEFRLPEVTSLAEALLGARMNDGGDSSAGGPADAPPAAAPAVVWERPFGDRTESPLWYAHLLGGDAMAAEVARRSMLCKAMLEVWAEGATLEELRAALAAYPAEEKERWGGAEQSFKFVIEVWGSSWPMAQQVELIDSLEHCTAFKGPIDLCNPSQRFWVIAAQSTGRGLPPLPHRFYFGRQVGVGDRGPLTTYELPRRRYLGPTSMDTEMAFLMCHLAKVRRGGLVLDPFVGTGSILVPAAHLGALTMGWDIDIRVIKLGKKDKAGRPVNVWTNFADYSLPPPLGLLRCDLHTAPLRPGLEGVLDAIVCDPPYGVRAGGRKSVAKEREIRHRESYVPSTDPYTVAECLHDLLEAAARLLVRGGRLAYFLPAAEGYYKEEELPRHPALEFVANCEQHLTTRYSRRLIVMEKVRRYDAAAAAAYFEQRGPPRMSVDDMHEYVYKTPAQLAADAGMSLEALRAAQAARMPRNRGKNI